MKKILIALLICSIFILSLTACASVDTSSSSGVDQSAEESEEESTENTTENPTDEASVEKPTEEPAPDPNDTQVMIEQLLINPSVVFYEDAIGMMENEGGQFGFVEIKNYNAEENVFEFTSGSDGAYAKLNVLLDEFGDNREKGSSQGILFKFQSPEDINSFYFNFYGPNDSEFGVNFNNENKPSMFIFLEATQELFEGDLVLETGKVFYLLIALDSNGEVTSAVWEDGNIENRATYTDNLAKRQGGENYQNSSRSFSIGFAANDTLKIVEYSILTFDGIKH